MEKTESIAVFHQYIIPVKETISLIKEMKDRHPVSSLYFVGNRRHIQKEELDTLRGIIPERQIILFEDDSKISQMTCFLNLRKLKFDYVVIPVLLSCYSFPARYRKALFIALYSARRIKTYDVEEKQLNAVNGRIFFKMLWYDYFILCLLIFFLPATLILMVVLAYNRCRILMHIRHGAITG